MISPAVFFVSPAFLAPLRSRVAEAPIFPFSDSIESCREQFCSLSPRNPKDAVLLFESVHHNQENLPVVDHINLSTENPLIGPVDESLGPRFPDMSTVYEQGAQTGIVVVQGHDPDLSKFEEPWIAVRGGVWEAIALKHRGCQIQGWVIGNFEKWVRDQHLDH